jgi:hypothetical protein|tara:strand:+ start:687 stop:872 length:186 start_codon:yes stop_codon:yes gene_type:complete
MNEDRLEIQIREATNGWVVEFNKYGETIEYIYSRPGPALSFVKKVMNEDEDVFAGVNNDSE